MFDMFPCWVQLYIRILSFYELDPAGDRTFCTDCTQEGVRLTRTIPSDPTNWIMKMHLFC